jgi:hypothetical protein
MFDDLIGEQSNKARAPCHFFNDANVSPFTQACTQRFTALCSCGIRCSSAAIL